MMRTSCPREGDVHRAIRTGTWEEMLRGHAAECEVCGEIIQVSRWMQTLAEGSERTHALLDPGVLWWRAQLSENQAKTEKAQIFLDWAEFIFATFLFIALAGWSAWKWDAIQRPLASLLTVAGQLLSVPGSWAVGAAPILSSYGVVILSLLALGLAYPLLVRD